MDRVRADDLGNLLARYHIPLGDPGSLPHQRGR